MQLKVEKNLNHIDINNNSQKAAPSVEEKIHKFVPPPLLRSKKRRNIYSNTKEECKYSKNF